MTNETPQLNTTDTWPYSHFGSKHNQHLTKPEIRELNLKPRKKHGEVLP